MRELKNVPPDERGIPITVWRRRYIDQNIDAWKRAARAVEPEAETPVEAPVFGAKKRGKR